ncbi:MAG: putative Se/S carrier-like protein [Christensenellales bacterium]
MRTILAIFRSRSETLSFANILKSYGVGVSIINTPRSANVSCGISASFAESGLEYARTIIARRNFFSFAGLFEILPSINHDISLRRI